MKNLVDQERVRSILPFIEDKDAFILDLIEASNEANRTGDASTVEQVLDEWEACAELASIPGLVEKVKKRYHTLLKSGLINEQ